jgi:hypothetical protein
MTVPQPFQYQGGKRALAALPPNLIPLHGSYRKRQEKAEILKAES